MTTQRDFLRKLVALLEAVFQMTKDKRNPLIRRDSLAMLKK